jgi:hypothetical protein
MTIIRSRCGRDRMVVGFTTTYMYAINNCYPITLML